MKWVKEGGKEYENLSYIKSLWEINCLEKMIRQVSVTSYDNKDNVIFSFGPPFEWGFIIPETISESLYKKVC